MFSREEVDYLIRDVRLLDQCLEEDKGSTEQHITVKGRIARDKCMTENVEWILDHEGPNSKIVLWAHNGHMNKLSTWMGGYLKISLKDQYYALGFDFNKGGFRAKDLKDHKITNFTVGDAGNGSTGEFFSQLEMPAFFTDIAGAVKGDNSRRLFFTQKMPSRTIGAAFDPQDIKSYYTDQSLYAQFDGLIFINETTPTVGIQ
jgi:erythromycin esterase